MAFPGTPAPADPNTTDPWTFSEESAPVPPSTVTLVEGSSFTICDAGGDIAGRGIEGLFVADTRICSRLLVTVDDHLVDPLTVAKRTPFAASFVGRTVDRAFLVFRDIWVGLGMRQDIRVRNLTHETRSVVVRAIVATDLAELFAVKAGRTQPANVTRLPSESELRFVCDDGRRGLVVRGDDAEIPAADSSLAWRGDIGPGEDWTVCLELSAVRGRENVVPRYRCGEPHEIAMPTTRQEHWQRHLPRLDSNVVGLTEAVARTGEDLGALRLFDPEHPEEPVIAAGAPWYMTLFGRDSILTSWMALLLDPTLGIATARTLARLQGTRDDPETEEQPGRILHEVRFSGGPSLALSEGAVYYGTADATPLFVMLVHELWRWGLPLEELWLLLPAVDAALGWVAGPGDPDGDGYIEYRRSGPHGLTNQGWKDSHDGVSFADGRLPDPPVALAEVQGYAYAAWRAGARLSAATGDQLVATERETRATALKAQFDRDFWMPDRKAFAIALDGEKRQVDSVTSNMGHCLWSGIVTDPDKAEAVARWLASPEMYTGWGTRTLATSMQRYNPISYHNGSTWPHDTAICVAGLRRAGFVDEALEIASGLLAAAQASGSRLPELFAGLTAEEMPVPVPYPASCSPQAWASAAPLLLVRSMLALEPDVPEGRVELDPVLPGAATRLELTGMPLGGARVTVEVDRDALAVRGLPRGLALIRPAV